jgi:hypothetical protein
MGQPAQRESAKHFAHRQLEFSIAQDCAAKQKSPTKLLSKLDFKPPQLQVAVRPDSKMERSSAHETHHCP